MQYSQELTEVLKLTNILSQRYSQNSITSKIFMLAIADAEECNAYKIFRAKDIDPVLIRETFSEGMQETHADTLYFGASTPPLDPVLESAFKRVQAGITSGEIGSFTRNVESQHILWGFLKAGGQNDVKDFLISAGITEQDLKTNKIPNAPAPGTGNKKEEAKILAMFGTNLNDLAKEGKIDPIIGRQTEIDRVVQTLSRRKKNNPLLVGDAGVGKTAIAEGIAIKIVDKHVPLNLMDKVVYSIDVNSMVAGTKFRGQFEERLQALIKEIIALGNIIIFIDEIHTILGSGNAQGELDMGNVLKPHIAKGTVQCIGATTFIESKKYIEKDPALARRFQKIIIEEPSIEDTIQIVGKLRAQYGPYHKVLFPDNIVKEVVYLATRYIPDRFQPDSSIDILDELGAMVKIKALTIDPEIREEMDKINEEIQEYTKVANYDECAILKTRRDNILNEAIAKLENKEDIEITIGDLHECVSKITGIDIRNLSQSDIEKLRTFADDLEVSVKGQRPALEKVANSIKLNKVGLNDPNRPIASFAFLGSTGVGKTYIAKMLTERLYGSVKKLIRFDMSEYMEKFNVSRLVGAPPGYVGYEEGGQLTEAVRKNPHSVILFDEIEKAHPDVLNILLQILDEGHVTDAQGVKVNFKNTIMILTSNVGTSFSKSAMGYGSHDPEKEDDEQKRIMKALKKSLRKELINRLDDIIVFNRLTKENAKEIVDVFVRELNERTKFNEYSVSIDEKVKELVVNEGFDKEFGARELKRAFKRLVEDAIAEYLLNNSKSNTIKLSVSDNKIIVV